MTPPLPSRLCAALRRQKSAHRARCTSPGASDVDWRRPQMLSADSRLWAIAIELGQIAGAQFLRHVSAGETVSCHLPQVFVGNAKRSLDRGIVLVNVASEIRRIIRIDSDTEAGRVQLANIVRLHVGKHAQHNVGEWAKSQRRTLLGEHDNKNW